MSRCYRRDGTPYPDGDEGVMEWARDHRDMKNVVVRQETLWNGIWLSTVWLGLDHAHGGPPLIFESMAFNNVMTEEIGGFVIPGTDRTFPVHTVNGDVGIQIRYHSLEEAEGGHIILKYRLSSIRYTIQMMLKLLKRNISQNPYD